MVDNLRRKVIGMCTCLTVSFVRVSGAACAAWVLLGLSAAASTVDFDAVPPGERSRPFQTQSVVVQSGAGSTLFIYNSGDFGMPRLGGFCMLGSDFSCSGNGMLLFSDPVSQLSLRSRFVGRGDRATLRAWSGPTLVDEHTVTSDEIFSFKGEGITRMEITGRRSPSGGVAFSSVSFVKAEEPPAPSPVDAPLSLLSLGSALALLPLVRRFLQVPIVRSC